MTLITGRNKNRSLIFKALDSPSRITFVDQLSLCDALLEAGGVWTPLRSLNPGGSPWPSLLGKALGSSPSIWEIEVRAPPWLRVGLGAWLEPCLVTKSSFWVSFFVKSHWLARVANQSTFFPYGNTFILVLDPWRAIWADTAPFKGPQPRLVWCLQNSRDARTLPGAFR